MIITDLSVQKKDGRFNLYIDGDFYCGIGSLTLSNFLLYKGKEVDQGTLDQILDYEIYHRFYDKAITYVTGRYKTERDVSVYIKRLYRSKRKDWIGEGVDYDIDSTIAKIIIRLNELGMIDDLVYAQTFVDSRSRNKPRSKRTILSELIAKGVSREDAEKVVEDIDDDDLLYKLYIKKYGEVPFNLYEDSKVVGFLSRKGFGWDEIAKLERRLKDEFGK